MTDRGLHHPASLTALLLGALPGVALAGGWEAFHDRCVMPLESLAPPLTAGLDRIGSDGSTDRYALTQGQQMLVEHAPQDGLSACAIVDQTGAAEAGFDLWLGQQIAAKRYVPAGAQTWRSHEWTEPVLELQKRRDGDALILRMLETRLEA